MAISLYVSLWHVLQKEHVVVTFKIFKVRHKLLMIAFEKSYYINEKISILLFSSFTQPSHPRIQNMHLKFACIISWLMFPLCESIWLSGVFREYKIGTLSKYGLMVLMFERIHRHYIKLIFLCLINKVRIKILQIISALNFLVLGPSF